MKKQIWLPILIMVIVIVVGVLIYSSQRSAVPEEKEVIKIGVSLPLSGSAAQLGKWALEGIQIAQKENNFEIEVQDDQCQGSTAVNAFRQLQFSGIKAMIGPLCNAASIPVSRISEDEKVVMITVGVSTKAIREVGDYSFTILPPIEAQTKKMAEYLIDKSIDKVSVVYVQDEYGSENNETFISVFSKYGKIINTAPFESNTTDFRTILTKIKLDDSLAILLVGYSKNFINLINQINELGIDKNIFSVSNIQDPSVISATGNLSEGIIYTYPQIFNSESYSTFLKKYNAQFQKDVTMLPMYVGAGYDAANILSQTIMNCGSNTECVKNSILRVKDYSGVNGIISIDEQGNAIMPIEIRVIKNGQFVPYDLNHP